MGLYPKTTSSPMLTNVNRKHQEIFHHSYGV